MAEPASRRVQLTRTQFGIWRAEQLAGGAPLHNEAVAFRVHGPLDLTVLQDALTAMSAERDIIRMSVDDSTDEPHQVFHTDVVLTAELTDTTGVDPRDRDRWLGDWLAAATVEPFDLAAPPLVRVRVVRFGPREHVLLFAAHHLAADAWSVSQFLTELAHRYGATFSHQPSGAAAIGFADFACAERAAVDDAEGTAYWRRQLAGLRPPDPIPGDLPSSARRGAAGRLVHFSLPSELVARLRALSRAETASLPVSLLAGVTALVHRLGGHDDVVVGVPAVVRGGGDWSGVLGPMLNLLACRSIVPTSSTFRELLAEVRTTLRQALRHRRIALPYVAELVPSAGGSPFQVVLSIHPVPSELVLPGLRTEALPVHNGTAKFDLSFVLRPSSGGGFDGSLEYRVDRYSEAMANRIAVAYVALLTAAAADPEASVARLDTMPASERQRVVLEFNAGERVALSDKPISAYVRQWAASGPERPAVGCGGEVLTYGEVDRQADAVARALGPLSGARVVVALPRRVDVVPVLLGIWRAGGVYVPIRAGTPRRAAHIVADSGAVVMVVDEARPGWVDDGVRVVTAAELCRADTGWTGETGSDASIAGQPAYLVYTSGSTGAPKGVAVGAGAYHRILHSYLRTTGLGPDDVCLGVSAFTFDAAMLELGGSLMAGARLELAADEAVGDGVALAETVTAVRPTVMFATPSTWRMILDAGWAGDRRLRLLCGAEPLPSRLAADLLARGGELWNLYGPTETTIFATACLLRAGDEITVGRPIDGVYCHILDRCGAPVPVGVVGELHIGGAGVDSFYWERDELTALSFVDDPVRPEEGRRVYRTGDRARYLGDGRIVLLGRADDQVKVRGHRIELGEVEAALRNVDGIDDAAVVHVGEPDRLVAFVVSRAPGGPPAADDLRATLRAWLTDAMLPAAYVVVPSIPVNANGKVDRVTLTDAAGAAAPTLPTTDAAAKTPTEQRVLALVAAVLDRPPATIGVSADFFVLGGDSLQATRLLTALRQHFGVRVRLAELVKEPTVAAMARLVGTGLPDEPPMPVDGTAGGAVRSASAQERLIWMFDAVDPGSPAFHLPMAIRLTGSLDRAALDTALCDLLAGHEILRTTYQLDGETISAVVNPAPTSVLRVVDVTGLSPDARPVALERLIELTTVRPFDLTTDLPLRATLVQLAPGEASLLLVGHHIALDGWSVRVAVEDLAAWYRHRVGLGAPPQAQAGSYAALADRPEEQDRALGYWSGRLEGHPGVLPLPYDEERPPLRDARGADLPVRIADPVARRVRDCAIEHGTTPFTVLFAVYAAVLARYSGTTDVIVGMPVANRDDPAVERTVGCFTTTLPVRVDASGYPSLRTLIGRLHDHLPADIDHAAVPLDRLTAVLDLPRDAGRTPLIQAMFAFQGVQLPQLRLPGVTSEADSVRVGYAKYDVSLLLADDPAGNFSGVWEYSTGLLPNEVAAGMRDAFVTALSAALAAPDTPLVGLVGGPSPEPSPAALGAGADPTPLIDRFLTSAAATPDAPAIRFAGRTLTYAEVAGWSTAIAARLRDSGPPVPSTVAVLVTAGPVQVAATFGVLAAGHRFVYLDPDEPVRRRQDTVADATPACVLTTAGFAEQVADELGTPHVVTIGEDADVPPAGTSVGTARDTTHCLVYTSGSTGRPKGMAVPDATFTQYSDWLRDTFAIGPGSRVVLWAPFTYDAAYTEVHAALLHGAVLAVPEPAVRRDPVRMLDWLAAEHITHFETVPSFLNLLTEVLAERGRPAGEQLPDLRHVLVAGEVLAPALANVWTGWMAGGGPRLHNLYGPTECILATHHELVPGHRYRSRVPIGVPIEGRDVLVLDEHGRPAPPGAVGTIHLRSAYLVDGYWRRAEETAVAFVADPGSVGGTLYRTGDRGRWRADGALEFLGRTDFQAKIRGNRVELASVEAVLAVHPAVRECVAVARSDGEDIRLVAYVTPRPHSAGVTTVTAAELRAHVAASLPQHSVPDHVVLLSALPRTRTHKVDRAALPDPDETPHTSPVTTDPVVGPAVTGVEQVIALVWQEVLGLERVGRSDNFFESGGNSMLAARLQIQLSKRLGRTIGLLEVFEHPTVAEFAAHVSADATGHSTADSTTAREPAGPAKGATDRAHGQQIGQQRRRAALRMLSAARRQPSILSDPTHSEGAGQQLPQADEGSHRGR